MENTRVAEDLIYGINPLLEALVSDEREFRKIVITKEKQKKSPAFNKILTLARKKNIAVNTVTDSALKKITGVPNHQGVAAYLSAVTLFSYSEVVEKSFRLSKAPVIALLDGVQDPGNLGSIVRSAEVLGIHGLLIPQNRSAGVTATVVKRSAGATEHLPIAVVTNLTRTIEDLKEKGFWVTGLEKGGEKECSEHDYSGPTALVIGGESKGISRLVRENCDFIVSIPMKGKVSSLNVSSAAAILFYEVLTQREKKSRTEERG